MYQKHVLDIAAEVLLEAGEPMHINLIAIEAQSKGLLVNMSFEEFVKKLSSALPANLNTAKPKFAKIKNRQSGYQRGVYRLIKRRASSPADLFPTQEPAQTTNTNYLGRAGEMAVMSELLFRNFNVSMMMVDKGIDIVAANESGKYFHIQVKTTSSIDNTYTFTIQKKAFESNNSGQTFYCFVMKSLKHTDYLILPNSFLANYIARDIVRGNESLSVRVNYDQKTKKYILNKKMDVTVHVNTFAQIN